MPRVKRACATGLSALAAAAALSTLTSCDVPTVSASDFAALRQCESSGNYLINTGNGFYGAYQFDLTTWQGLGFSGLPNLANPAIQDAAAYTLYNQRGWQPWPSCSAQLGLQVSGQAPPPPPQPPHWDGTYLTTAYAGQQRSDVAEWQQAMRNAGWTGVSADGYYGPTTSDLAAFVSGLFGVSDGPPGTVGPNLWNFAFVYWQP
jgi:hypothetical protein